jgi:hypothetical protein
MSLLTKTTTRNIAGFIGAICTVVMVLFHNDITRTFALKFGVMGWWLSSVGYGLLGLSWLGMLLPRWRRLFSRDEGAFFIMAVFGPLIFAVLSAREAIRLE